MICTLSFQTPPFCCQLIFFYCWSFRPNMIFWRGSKLILYNNSVAIILSNPVFFSPWFQSLINEFKGASIWVLRSGCIVHTDTHKLTNTQARIKIQKVGLPLWQHYCSLQHISAGISVSLYVRGDFRGRAHKVIIGLQMFSALSFQPPTKQPNVLFIHRITLYINKVGDRECVYDLTSLNKLINPLSLSFCTIMVSWRSAGEYLKGK